MHKRNAKMRKKNKIFLRTLALIAPVILLVLLSQTAFARNTYVITDGDRIVVHTTASTDPAQVLDEAGLALGEDDTYTTQPGMGVSEITICRAQNIVVNNCGNLIHVDSQGETVQQLLSRLNIDVGVDTTVSASMDTATYDGMVLNLSRTIRTTETYTANLPHEVTYCYDASIPAGQTVVLTKGVDGQALRTASVVYADGVEISRTVLEQTVIQQPVSEVIAIGNGTKEVDPRYVPEEPVIGDGFIITTTGEVLTYTHTHQVLATAYTHTDEGCDFITATGTTVRIGTVAVDPRLIPYGTRMFIVTNDGEYVYGVATAEDCGGGIKGDRLDLYFPTTAECFQFGRRKTTIYFIGDSDIEY